MGECTAPFCNNSSAKGYIMKIFPKDPVRRALWAQNISSNWTPTNNSRLCEVHFAPEMWDTYEKHKLKRDAVPTIFGFFLKKQILTRDTENYANTISDVRETNTKSSEYIDINEEATDNVSTISANVTSITECNENKQPTRLSSFISTLKEDEKKEYEKCKELTKKQYLRIVIMKKKLKILKQRNRMLKNKIDSDAYKKAVSRIFNEDQLRALFKNKKGHIGNWSNETIQRALKYKFACGVSGYEELLRQGIPLPSLRTLSRKLEDFKKSHDIFEIYKFENLYKII